MSGINSILEDIERFEQELLKKFPKQKGRVLRANAKSNTDAELGKPSNDVEEMKWAVLYRENLKRLL
jgi:hypothetical protein